MDILERRVGEHNKGKRGAKYTRAKRPVTLEYSEKYNSKSDALKREYEVKHYSKILKEELLHKGSK
jgi:putative endonuclease